MTPRLCLVLASALFFSAGCDDAPLSISSYSMPQSVQSGERSVSIEALLREGEYCADIRIGKEGDSSIQETNEFFDGKVSVRYSIEIPNTGFSEDVNLGVFDPDKYGSFYEDAFAFHRFTVEVDGAETYRSKAYIVAVFEGDEEILKQSKFGVTISEWGCK